MATGSFVPLNKAKYKIGQNLIDLDSHSFNAVLVTSAWSPSAAYAGTSTDARYSDISANEVSGTGYTAGGQAMTSVAFTVAGTGGKFTSAAPSWSNATLTAKYLVIIDQTNTNKDILGYVDLDTTNGTASVSPTNGTISVTPDATNGWFTIG
jgi:hypothetical protein